ncbi:STAS domain-containing protein [Streptosporangium sp. NBC_01639]|uniref:STAS domain-containing protein n=1 Tax=unclassified Streptosporangium TaxID=2632669 RepID=UPI002DDC34DF|nr:STAS domain-containing protein [Streptosporangium sp. NBC_01756]WSC87837.1 STAS domain-containing protein [Streptosporangium sp. NBC_01756]WTD53458.1 STAS domain-containing protein [Streptosporangium sp. NBC_01639]
MTTAVRFTLEDGAQQSVASVPVVALSGDLDFTNAERLRDDIRTVLAPDQRDLVLDLTALDFCDSTGIRIFLAIRTLLQERGGSVVLTGLNSRLSRIFRVTGLVQAFAVQPTVAEAVAFLRPRS